MRKVALFSVALFFFGAVQLMAQQDFSKVEIKVQKVSGSVYLTPYTRRYLFCFTARNVPIWNTVPLLLLVYQTSPASVSPLSMPRRSMRPSPRGVEKCTTTLSPGTGHQAAAWPMRPGGARV